MIVSLSNIKKSFNIFNVLENITFHINEKDKIGIVGINGCGKTTLFKIITGQEKQDSGDVFIRKNIKVGYLDQIPNYDMLVRDVLYLAFKKVLKKKEQLDKLTNELKTNSDEKIINRYTNLHEEFMEIGGYDIDVEFRKIVTGLKINEDLLQRNFETLSGGEKSRVILGKILLEKPDLLLLDEPTNHLDLQSIIWLENYLSRYDGAVLVISHDRFLLDRIVNQIVNIENGKSHIYKGNYSYYIKEKAVRMDSLWKEYAKQNKKIKKMEDQIERYRIWGKMRDSDKMYRRAKELEKRLDRMDKLDKPFQNRMLKFNLSPAGRVGNEAIKVKELGISFDSKNILKNVTFTIRYGDKAFLIGDNGSGKTSIFNALMQNIPHEGEVKFTAKAKIGRLQQEVSYPVPTMTVLQEYRREKNIGDGEARKHLAQFLFWGDDVFKQVNEISGGEKTRLELCKLVNSDTNILLLDEPTNHLDIDSKEMLENNLSEYKGTLLVISHDRYFIGKLADYTLVLDEGTLLHDYDDFDDFHQNRKKDEEKLTLPPKKKKPRRVKKVDYQKKIDDLESKLTSIALEIDETLKEPMPDYDKIAALIEEKEELEEVYLELIDNLN